MAIWWNEARGKYEYDWEDAAKVRHRGYARTKGEAERLRAEKMVEASKATELLGDPDQTVADFANQWLKRLKNSDLKPSTIDNYSRLYKGQIAAAIGPIRLRNLRRTHIREFLNTKREQISATDGTKKLSKNTVRLIRATLSVILGEALDDELIKTNPAAIPSRRRGKKGDGTMSAGDRQKAIRPSSDHELAKVLEAASEHDPEYHPLFLLLARTGMRPGEAFALQWTDLNFTKRKILFERAFSDGELGTTKTGGVRNVDMSQELALAITGLYRKREAHAVKSGAGAVGDLVFINRVGNPMDISRVRKRFIRVLKKAGVSGHRLYDLRHTFATSLLAKNAPITYVAAQLGHAKPTTTLQHYARWLPQADAGFVDRLDSFWHQSGTNRPRQPASEVLEIKKAASMKDSFCEPSGTRTRAQTSKTQVKSVFFASGICPDAANFGHFAPPRGKLTSFMTTLN